MLAFIKGLHRKPVAIRILEWGKLVSITGGAQAVVQATALLSGIFIIRFLPQSEYALYTLANTMMGTLTILADGGISAGVMALGGKQWQDKKRLGVILVTGLELRKKFAVGSFLISMPILLYLLLHNNASWINAIFILVSVAMAFFITLSTNLLEVPLKLKQDILPLQKNLIQANLGRFLMIVSMVVIFPFSFFAILGNALPRLWSNYKLRKLSAVYADWEQPSDVFVKKELLGFVRKVIPGSVYFCLSGQITIWLISIFGTITSLASVGALSRLTIALTLISVLFSTLVVPRYARIPSQSPILLIRFLQAFLSLVVVCLLIIGFTLIFSNELLWILGPEYSSLQKELVLSVSAGCIGLLSGLVYNLSLSRSWIIQPIVGILISLLVTVSGIFLFDFSTLQGVLYLGIYTSFGELLKLTVFFFLKLFQSKQ
ncbi:MAG: polysaccharide biosynthesis protein [Chitinophagaceae bacterium]|nr:MAG: polysaccharide biosynthesis protein [Chitinophagaceae bacterium]